MKGENLMKKLAKRSFSLLMILVMALTMMGASMSVSFAAAPEIYQFCGDKWIWPGSTDTLWVYADGTVDGVRLEKKTAGDSWVNFGTCSSIDSEDDYWTYGLSTEASDEGQEWIFRFALVRDGDVGYSPEFKVKVTSDLGMDRIAGSNRFDTAIRAADTLAPYTDNEYKNVVIACGTDFADALGGTYLAAKYSAPILLVNKSVAVMDTVADKVQAKLAPGGKVFILGGAGAIPEYMESALAERGITDVKRFAGKNRYDTNLEILKYCGLSTEEVMVCCGTEFADALSASALGFPILLVGKTLTDDQKAFMSTLDPEWVNMVGGVGAVPQAVKDWFDSNGFETWRYAGANRYETSYMLAYDYIYQQSYRAFLAYALDFPDGLAAGPLAFVNHAPLLLVNNSNYMYAERFVFDNDCRVGIAMGGPSLISDGTLKRIMEGSDITGGSGAPEAVRASAEDQPQKPAPEWSKRSIE